MGEGDTRLEESIDVTVPIQCLVKDSRLELQALPKVSTGMQKSKGVERF